MPAADLPADPPHPMHALTTYEIRDYKRELEHAIKGIAADAPVQAQLRAKLDAVIAEQEERARIASRARA
jgi:hypothetical protein